MYDTILELRLFLYEGYKPTILCRPVAMYVRLTKVALYQGDKLTILYRPVAISFRGSSLQCYDIDLFIFMNSISLLDG